MKTLSVLIALVLSFVCGPASAQTTVSGYDVILLVGQSNMVGYGTGTDNASDAAVNPRVFMWDANNNVISPAIDPLVQNQSSAYVGMGLTFGKAYAASIASNRKVLLVGSATGGTGFYTGAWLAPNGSLATTAVARANAAMVAAGPGARFAGILWHQGESDLLATTSAATYRNDLTSLITFLRTNIVGASSTTPVVVGEFTYPWMTDNIVSGTDVALQAAMMQVFHTLPDTMNNTAWVNTGGLPGDLIEGDIHFSAISQRQLGRRYADRLFLASLGVVQPEFSQEGWASTWFDDGRSYSNGSLPVNLEGTVTGSVNVVADPVRGNVAQISGGTGTITYMVPSQTFNGDYTKMVWFKPGAAGYYNNLIAGLNPGQNHWLAAVSFKSGSVVIAAGHANGNSTPVALQTTIAAPAGLWMHICLVYSAQYNAMGIYVNGTAVALTGGVKPAPPLSGTAPVSLNIGSYGGQSGTDGSIAGARVWNSLLNAQQVQAIYNYELNFRAGW